MARPVRLLIRVLALTVLLGAVAWAVWAWYVLGKHDYDKTSSIAHLVGVSLVATCPVSVVDLEGERVLEFAHAAPPVRGYVAGSQPAVTRPFSAASNALEPDTRFRIVRLLFRRSALTGSFHMVVVEIESGTYKGQRFTFPAMTLLDGEATRQWTLRPFIRRAGTVLPAPAVHDAGVDPE